MKKRLSIIYTEQRIVEVIIDDEENLFKDETIISNRGCYDEDEFYLAFQNGLDCNIIKDARLLDAIDGLLNVGEVDWTTSKPAVMGNFMVDSISVEKYKEPKTPYKLWDRTYRKMSYLELGISMIDYIENYIVLSPSYIRDMNGVMIYEGDIVSFKNPFFQKDEDESEIVQGEVIFENGLCFIKKDSLFDVYPIYLLRLNNLKIIGNKYER